LRRFDAAEAKRLRQGLQDQDNIRFVNKQEFRQLLVSFRRLVRSNVADARLHGLQDPASGMRYVIEEEELFSPDHVSVYADPDAAGS
jgi:hypothetical protein